MSISTNGLVTLMTDLGLRDPYVGIMKGIMISRFPQLKVIDLSHGVPPQDITWAAYALAGSYKNFPQGTVHCAVVDPGAGTERRILVAESNRHAFVAPDNGLLTEVLRGGGSAWAVDLERVPVAPVRRSFHNRDVIAPIGALIAGGKLAVDQVGEEVEFPTELETWPKTWSEEMVNGVVLGADHFGNLFTSISEADLPGNEDSDFIVEFAGHKIPLSNAYSDAPPGRALALFNGFGLLEVAIRNGKVAEELDWQRGSPVSIRVVPKE